MVTISYIFKRLTDGIEEVVRSELAIDRIEMDRIVDLKSIRELNASKMDQFKRRLQRGDKCFIATYEENAVAYAWVRLEGNMYLSSIRKQLPIPQNSMWVFDCRTGPAYRGMGIYPWLLGQLARIHSGLVGQMFIDTTRNNKASVRGIKKAGFALWKKILFIQFLRVRIRLEF